MNRFDNVLYVADGAVDQTAPLAKAVALAASNQATLTVIAIIPDLRPSTPLPPGVPTVAELRMQAVAQRREALESMVEPHRDRVGIVVDVVIGKPFLEVIRAVLRDGHDVVVKPAENPSWLTRLFGSDDMHLLRKCPCPVWLLKPDDDNRYSTIVAAVDADPLEPDGEARALSLRVLELAAAVALAESATLHVVHVWDAPEAGFVRLWANDPDRSELDFTEGERVQHKMVLDALMRELRGRLGADAYDYLKPRQHLPQGAVERALPDQISRLGADLLVMGTVARTGIPGLIIGNTAESVLDQLACSVLAIKPEGFVSPVSL